MLDCSFWSTSFILKNVYERSAEFASIKSAPYIYSINNVFGETPVRWSQRGDLCNSFSCSFLYSVYLIRQSASDFSGNRRPEPRRSVHCHGSASSDDYDSVHHLQAAGSRPAAQSVRGSPFSLRPPARQRSACRDQTHTQRLLHGLRCDASSCSFEGLRQGDEK